MMNIDWGSYLLGLVVGLTVGLALHYMKLILTLAKRTTKLLNTATFLASMTNRKVKRRRQK